MSEQYVIVSHYQPPTGKRPIVHVWGGPWFTREAAMSAMRWMRGNDLREHGVPADEVTYWVRKVLP